LTDAAEYYLVSIMTTRPAKTAPVSLKLGAGERERLAALATARKRTPHYLMREAVSEYLGREEMRQSFRDEAAKALQDYKETGLHVTQDQVDEWIDSLGTRRPKRHPKWHK
jgi:predicted transcriptional regulator